MDKLLVTISILIQYLFIEVGSICFLHVIRLSTYYYWRGNKVFKRLQKPDFHELSFLTQAMNGCQ